jgi:hypothetical protein
VIVELDKSDALSQIEISKLNLSNAELRLKKLIENTSQVEVKKQQLTLSRAKETLSNSKLNLAFFEREQKRKLTQMEDTLKQKENELIILEAETKVNISALNSSPANKEQELAKAKNSLITLEFEYERDKANFELDFTKKEQEYYASIEKEYLNIEESTRSLSKSFDNFDELFQIKGNTSYSNNYNIYFSAKKDTYKNEAKTYLSKAYSSFIKIENKLDTLSDKRNIKVLLELIEDEKDLYASLSVSMERTMKALDNSVESFDFDA